jgi:hypothetical protein
MMDNTDRGSIYDHDITNSQHIPSLTASLEAFDPERSIHSAYSGRSNMHSSRWSIPPENEESEAESEGPWAPPAWQKSNNQWYRKSLLGEGGLRASPSRSPLSVAGEREVTPSRIPLPESPRKGTPRTSPDPEPDMTRFTPDNNIASRMQSPSVEPQASEGAQQSEEGMALSSYDDRPGNVDGCRSLSDTYLYGACAVKLTCVVVKLSMRAETMFRTKAVEDTVSSFNHVFRSLTRSRSNVIFAAWTIVVAWLLVYPWSASLIPDIANVANMAKQFEPLMYASENVIPRSRELAETSIAVEDLGESVRATNMSGSNNIIKQLDDLGDSLKVLSIQITTFFTHVDGDMDE